MKGERLGSVVAGLVAVGLFIGVDVAICPTAGVLGVPCPSCGLTRASIELGTGHWQKAYAIHPGVIPALVYVIVAVGGARWWRRSTRLSLGISVAGGVLIACLTLLWGARFFGYFGGPVPVHAWW